MILPSSSTANRSKMANGRAVRQGSLDVDALGYAQSIFQFDTKITHRAVDFGVTKEQLHRAKIAGFTINLGSLCSAKRVCTISTRLQSNRLHPVADKSTVLTC